MFKKKPTIKPLAPLRSSDRRKLADQIIQDYELESQPTVDSSNEQTPEQKAEATAARTSLRNSLLPDNAQSARFTTTHGPDLKQASGTVYVGSQDGEDSRILWFQIEGRLYPSVYTLWRNPDIVPLLHTPSIVVKKLQGGADLMTPGLAGGPPFPPKAKMGAVVAVASTENPAVPIAVGVCEIDVSSLEKVQGAKGHAVENMHWAGDELWSYSVNGKAGQTPPEEIEGWVKVLEERGLAEQTESLTLDEQDHSGGGVALNDDDRPAGNAHKDPVGSADLEGEDPPDQVETKALSQKEIDDAFRNAFLYGVHHFKTTNANQKSFGLIFPLTQSFVMSTLVQPFLPTFTPAQTEQLQIKKTSYKNIKKFVKTLDKAEILKSKDRDGNEVVILDIDFEDPAITSFKPYRLPKKETLNGTSQGRGETLTEKIDTTSSADDSIGQTLRVLTFYKPTTKLSPIFPSANKTLFTPPEVRTHITSYIETEKLISPTNQRLVTLNPTLANAVFDGTHALDTEVLAKGSIPRDALIDRILHSMSTSYAIIRNDSTTDPASIRTKSGTPPKVHITLETRSGNKTVTKVSGLEAYHVNVRPLADELRKTCAGSTSVEPLAGAAKKNEREVMEVMVQGPQRDAVIKALERRGVDKRWVEVLDKTKKGKK